jgi:CRISPR type III-A-associated RAMP protein Csm5
LATKLAWTYTLRGNRLVEKREHDGEYKVFVEWLTPGTTLQLSLRIDDFLFSNTAERDLHFRGAKEQAVRQVAHTCNAYARAITTSEKAFYTKYSLDALRDFYSDLETTLAGLPEEAFLLNVGWGSGWEVKTVGDLLRTQLGTDGFKELRQRYQLGENPKTRQLDLNGLFPHTRRIAYDSGAPMWPMGWVKLIPARGET